MDCPRDARHKQGPPRPGEPRAAGAIRPPQLGAAPACRGCGERASCSVRKGLRATADESGGRRGQPPRQEPHGRTRGRARRARSPEPARAAHRQVLPWSSVVLLSPSHIGHPPAAFVAESPGRLSADPPVAAVLDLDGPWRAEPALFDQVYDGTATRRTSALSGDSPGRVTFRDGPCPSRLGPRALPSCPRSPPRPRCRTSTSSVRPLG
jgi:hypothetical protein